MYVISQVIIVIGVSYGTVLMWVSCLLQFTAIINMPQACILAVGGAEKKVVPLPDGGFGVKSVMLVSLTSDHRVVDRALGAEWLKAFKKQIENPLLLLL